MLISFKTSQYSKLEVKYNTDYQRLEQELQSFKQERLET